MGQLVGVTEKPTSAPGVVRYELNRTLSGMGHERFVSLLDADGATPSSSLARQLLSTGKVSSVHIYSNIVTVDLEKGFTSDGLADIVREMYRYWKPGVVPPVFEEVEADEPAAGDAGAETGGGVELSAAAKRVPSHLLERSRAARERWKANNG
jgi:L-fucose mutarotase/ribose pyranase (RbsD/FucU family)